MSSGMSVGAETETTGPLAPGAADGGAGAGPTPRPGCSGG